jgi:hypothetical protein
VQQLEGEVRRLQRELESFQKERGRAAAVAAEASSGRGAAESAGARAAQRAASAASELDKCRAEVRRLQGYSKQLESAQRTKDAQVWLQGRGRLASCSLCPKTTSSMHTMP